MIHLRDKNDTFGRQQASFVSSKYRTFALLQGKRLCLCLSR